MSITQGLPDKNVCGVYQIRHVLTGDCYIGCGYIRGRLLSHIGLLRRGKHWSKPMQEAWNRDGPDAFESSVLWAVPKDSPLRTYHAYEPAEAQFIHDRQPAYNTHRSMLYSKYADRIIAPLA